MCRLISNSVCQHPKKGRHGFLPHGPCDMVKYIYIDILYIIYSMAHTVYDIQYIHIYIIYCMGQLYGQREPYTLATHQAKTETSNNASFSFKDI